MAASSSSSEYDVFLSFRGEDTRRKFTCHLYAALQRKAIKTFYDSRGLPKGTDISAVLQAVKSSRFSIVILSEKYADSTWCLRELVIILDSRKRGQIVVPIFYGIDPSDVRKHEASFAAAFEKHDRNSKIDKAELERWKSAFTEVGSISGWDSRPYLDESELIMGIVQDISDKLINMSSSKVDGLIGMANHIREMYSLLCLGVDDVRYIVIWGQGGIGKSTIAQATFDKISGQFDHRCFLEDVNLIGAVKMLKKLSKTILGDCTGCKSKRMERLRKHKFLLVLDGVENFAQVEDLLGRQCSFAGGTRIIITTRDKESLSGAGVFQYCPSVLNYEDAFELFVQHAFKTEQPTQEFKNLSSRATESAHGLPLILRVWGTSLYGKTLLEWEDELEKIKEIPHPKILSVLRRSYDGLDHSQQEIFLDVACFLRGMNRSYVTKILDRLKFPQSGLRVLLDKALVTISDDNFEMHDSLQKMAWEIVRQQSIEEPGRRSRLRSYKDVDTVMLTRNTATIAVQCITLDLSNFIKDIYINAGAFEAMTGLRLLNIFYDNNPSKHSKQHINGAFRYLSPGLTCLIWMGYPLKSLPCNFDSRNLVYLDMSYSCIEQLWEQTEIQKSHSALQNLVFLSLKGCKKLVNLPRFIDMKNLKKLDLSGCSNLENFPEISGIMEELSEVYLDETAIEGLHSSIERLQGLSILTMRNCKHLVCLPDNICKLGCLTDLILSGCSALYHLPKNLRNIASLRKLEVKGSGIEVTSSNEGDFMEQQNLNSAYYQSQSHLYSSNEGDFMEHQNLNTAYSQSQSHYDSCEPLSVTTRKRERERERERERGRRENDSLLTVESATYDSFHL